MSSPKVYGKMKSGIFKRILSALAVCVTIAAGIIVIIQFVEDRSNIDLSGEWELWNTVKETSYSPYRELRIGYRIFLQQNGNKIIGNGEKYWENEKTLPSQAHTPISIEGTVDGAMITATFTEQGTKRTTSGSFNWRISNNGTILEGRFAHTAANARGSSMAKKISTSE